MSSSVPKTLIIKIGATGDVVRTTALLHAVEGEIHWLTSAYNASVLPPGCARLTRVFSIENDLAVIVNQHYDLVLSLEEDPLIAAILPSISHTALQGVYADDGQLLYTKESAGWFDMSLVSVLGKEKADALKYQNRKTYQELIFEIAGKKFQAQPYWTNLAAAGKVKGLVGIEKRVGERWKGKAWGGYDSLAAVLRQMGYTVRFFSERGTLYEYMEDIGTCSYLISGDTLAMHLGIAYGLPTLAIFTCTAPWEIYDYGILHKVVSPALEQSFYKTAPVPAAMEAVSVEHLLEVFLRMSAGPAD